MDDLLGNALTEPIADMSNDVGDIEIDVVDDRPEDDRVAPRDLDLDTDVDEIDEYSGGVKKRINKLKYEYHEQRRAKESAERMREEAIRYAQQVATQNDEMRNLLAQGEGVLLNEMKYRARGDLDRARTSYKSAYEEGNTDNLLKAQEDLNRSQRFSDMAVAQGSVVPDHLKTPTPAMPPAQDPKLSGWMEKNSWFGDDEEMTSFAYGVHQNLVKSGVDPRSDEYYAKIDNRIREIFPGKFENGEGMEVPVASSRTNTVVAPANRSSGKPRKVQLTSTQVALARRLGLKPEQYAKQLLKESR